MKPRPKLSYDPTLSLGAIAVCVTIIIAVVSFATVQYNLYAGIHARLVSMETVRARGEADYRMQADNVRQEISAIKEELRLLNKQTLDLHSRRR